MIYHSRENRSCYFPPLLSNGEISFAPDAEGMLNYCAEDFRRKGVIAFDGVVVRCGRRSSLCNDLLARLFPFGKFTFDAGSKLTEWSQELIPEQGVFTSSCIYENGDCIKSKGFIHPTLNIYALQKSFSIKNGSGIFSYHLSLPGYDSKISKYMNILYSKVQNEACCIGFKLYGMDVYEGEIRAFIDKEYTATKTANGIDLSFKVSDRESVCFYYYLEDDLDGVDFEKQLSAYEEKIAKNGFNGLLAECVAHYKDFFDLGYIKTSDSTLDQIYQTALYSIKCNTTKHSIAVGLNNGYWDGKYFAFDEYSSYIALLESNRLELAKRVPIYRKNICLPSAIKRGSDCHRTDKTEDVAHFHWVTGEVDRFELASEGCWQDHIFHIPLIGIGAFNYYEYSGDLDFLNECYPMIRACSKYITRHMVYRDEDKFYIGRCTDIERLGASVQNPFLTACGAIKLLECCSKAAMILQTDEEYANECAYIAKKLCENLPSELDMYVPHLGCDQKSIVIFGGKYPFDVLKKDDEKMLRSWEDFELNGALYGNMYPVGKKISPWYACWKALGYARAERKDSAYTALKQAYTSAGVFNEMFEINEENNRLRPWFSTAAGVFVSAVNEMLLQCEESVVKILPGMPHSIDVSFKLAGKGGATVEATVKNGTLVKSIVWKDGVDVTEQFSIEF